MKKPITVVEMPTYEKTAQDIWDEEARSKFVDYISQNYERGDLIQGTGGLRKIRWSRPGMGKRGGARVIYYYYDQKAPVYLVAAFAKNVQENLTSDEKRYLTSLTSGLKGSIQAQRRGKNNG